MYIRKLRLRDVGVFVDATVDLNVPGATRHPRAPSNVTALVGDNAAGKTTVLRAIAIAALAAPAAIPTKISRSIVRRAPGASAHVGRLGADVVLADGQSKHVDIALQRRSSPRVSATASGRGAIAMPVFVVGYGATRDLGTSRGPARSGATTPYERVASLFEPHAAIVPPASWLVALARADRARYAEVRALLGALAGPGAEIVPERPAVDVDSRVTAFSDGQRAHVAWIGDMLRCACASLPPGASIGDARGLVLVDQIEQHVHVRWLARLVPSIARALPGVQFVVSTHSPLVVGSLWRLNVVVLEAHGADGTTVARPSREVFGLSVDQLLATGVFGDANARNDEVATALALTARNARDGDADAAVRTLRLLSLGGAALDERTAPEERARKVRTT